MLFVVDQSSRRKAFPDALRGTAVTNSIDRGSLKVADAGRRNAWSSSAETAVPGLSTTTSGQVTADSLNRSAIFTDQPLESYPLAELTQEERKGCEGCWGESLGIIARAA